MHVYFFETLNNYSAPTNKIRSYLPHQ